MPKAQPQANEPQVQVVDVTEKREIRSPLSGDMTALQPISELPDTHKHLAKVYPTATGFAVEPNGNISFHF